jgi:hypothetical protein
MRSQPFIPIALAVLLVGMLGWSLLHRERQAGAITMAVTTQTQEEKFEEFKKLCEYYLREEFKLPKSAPFPKLSEREVRLLSSGYHTFFDLPITDETGSTRTARVGCEMNGWADRFVISTYY